MKIVLVLLLAAPVILCSLNAMLNRLEGTHPHRTPFTAGLYTSAVFLPLYVPLHAKLFGVSAVPMLCGLAFIIIYLNCLVFLNWFLFTLTDVSMHIQLLLQVHRAGSITPEHLIARYNKDTIVHNRIPRLLELGQLRMQDGKLYVSGRSVMFGASVCVGLRRILGIPVRPELAEHLGQSDAWT
jgi:hypothetical protein